VPAELTGTEMVLPAHSGDEAVVRLPAPVGRWSICSWTARTRAVHEQTTTSSVPEFDVVSHFLRE
jgi:hypothetical protein